MAWCCIFATFLSHETLGVILENMDSQIKFKVLNSNNITNFEIIVELENVENGIPTEGVLKSLNSNLFWEVQNRIIESIIEKRFEYEDVIQSHINKTEPSIGNEEIIKQREEKNIRLYKIKPIGNTQKPEIGEDLVFHTTTFRSKIQIKEIYKSYFRLEDENGYIAVIPKRKVPKNSTAQIGDYVRHCEHQYHDLVDENDNFIYRH